MVAVAATLTAACSAATPIDNFHNGVIAKSGGLPADGDWPKIEKIGQTACDQLASGKFTPTDDEFIIKTENPSMSNKDSESVVASAMTYLCPDQQTNIPASWNMS